MKRLGWILVLVMAASPAWGARKITVQQLKDLLVSMQQGKKSDQEVASALEQVELTERLDRATMTAISDTIPGPFSTEQLYVLEAHSAVLAPPAEQLPANPAPDAAAQKAILEKAADYAAKTFAQLPHLTATKNTLRFQDNLAPTPAASEAHGKGHDPNQLTPDQVVHYVNAIETPVETQNGAEVFSSAKAPPQTILPGQIVVLGPIPVLSSVLQDAQAAGKLAWLRWETVNGSPAAVFSFAVDKKKSHLMVDDCCFPASSDTPGGMSYGNYGARAGSNSDAGSTLPALGGTTLSMPVTMQGQGGDQLVPYKSIVPYHGELFIDPPSGAVVRLITEAEFKSFEVIQQENQRIDYGPVQVGEKTLVLPVKSVIDTLAVPTGFGGFGKHPARRTLFTIDYKNYRPAATAEQK